jgi:hypothetical protein
VVLGMRMRVLAVKTPGVSGGGRFVVDWEKHRAKCVKRGRSRGRSMVKKYNRLNG